MKAVFIGADRNIVELATTSLRLRWPDLTFLVATNAANGLRFVKDESPDLIMLRPDFTDLSLTKAISGIRELTNVPVVVLGHQEDAFEAVTALEVGADDYIRLPCDLTELMVRVWSVLRTANVNKARPVVRAYSCFIAYGEPDRSFAEKLYNHLWSKGIGCWMYAMDPTPGEGTWGEIIKKRSEAERFIVLCSARGLLRDGVLKEIEEQIDEERDKIIPISLDDTWKEPGFPVIRGSRDLKPFLLERNYADFGYGRDYEESLQRLLRALERRDA